MSTLTDKQIENLHHTSSASFYFEQSERFEILDGEISEMNDENFHMRWYENQLEALFAFNYFSARHETTLLWDTAKNPTQQYCLRIATPFDPAIS